MKHKILLVLLLSSMACITATAQKVSMDFRQVKLAKVFDAITQQTGLTVAYSRPTVNPDKLVTVRADEEELAHVLDRLLAGMGVTYEISGKKVYLKAKAASEATHQSGKVKKISGVIVDEKGEPVIGASIAVKGTSLGTITNVDGEYTLMGVPEKAEVVISFIGYKTRTFSAGDKALTNIATSLNNDIGSLKALLVSRGSEYGTYDFMSEENYSRVEDNVVMETQAEISYLARNIMMAMNDIFCPNTTYTAADGTTYTVLDTANCSVGADGSLPPHELFAREGYDRYTQMEIDGKQFYVYNDETKANNSSWYKLGNVSVNPKLAAQVTLMPSYKQDGSANYGLADQITKAWSAENLYINPKDTSKCNFEGYYDKIISHLGTNGSIYKASSDTMTSTAAAIDNQRNQIMGVSSDEELTNMIKYQSAYNASSRFITVISQMTELIVQLI